MQMHLKNARNAMALLVRIEVGGSSRGVEKPLLKNGKEAGENFLVPAQ